MPTALICSSAPVENELGATVLWRRAFERRFARSLDEAVQAAFSALPTIVVVDCDLPWAERLVTELRTQGATQGVTIVALARGPVTPHESDLVAAGCDAVLRSSTARGWDARLRELVGLPMRRDTRLSVDLRVDAQVADDLVTAAVVNLSPVGMLIQCPVPLEVGHDIDFAFRLPEQPRLITGSGRVVRQAKPTQFGIEFLVIDEEDRERIRQLTLAG